MGNSSHISFTIHLEKYTLLSNDIIIYTIKILLAIEVFCGRCVSLKLMVLPQYIYLPTLFILFLFSNDVILWSFLFIKRPSHQNKSKCQANKNFPKYFFGKVLSSVESIRFPFFFKSRRSFIFLERQNIRSIILGKIYDIHLKTV